MQEDLFLTHYSDGIERLGLQIGGTLHALDDTLPSLDWLLTNVPAAELLPLILKSKGAPIANPGVLRLTLASQEIWAAGVTYKRSEEARERESHNSNIYTRVYDAPRPELFMKGMGYDAVSSGSAVGIRHDATWSVPEPELVVVLNARLEVIGFTIGNDMSSRDIEGENPLYLPQAKVYESSCAVGPRLWLLPGKNEWPDVPIHITINRAGEAVFYDETTSANLHRSLPDLVGYLGRCKRFRHGALLFTGTGIVPPDTFTLAVGDEVRITIDPIGELVNPVAVIPPQH
jgi:2-dehydro-3-deoxy-D-arabinonate dehydratase